MGGAAGASADAVGTDAGSGGASGNAGSAGTSSAGGSSGNAGTSGSGGGGSGGSSDTPPVPEGGLRHFVLPGGEDSYTIAAPGLLGEQGGAVSVVDGVLSTTRGGSVTLAADGSFTYAPGTSGFWGDDGFDGELDNGAGERVTVQVHLSVAARSIALIDVEAGTSNGFVVTGATNASYAGCDIAGGGDVNGDGKDDLLFGKKDNFSAHFIFGKTDFAGISTSVLAGPPVLGFAFAGQLDDYSGVSVANAGDVNGDGLDDAIVGASYHGATGAAFVMCARVKPRSHQWATSWTRKAATRTTALRTRSASAFVGATAAT